jgi:uncharacterized membrane protein YdfJ with MMPL/SSD domain
LTSQSRIPPGDPVLRRSLARPRISLAIAAGTILAAVLLSVAIPDRFKVAGFTTPGSESARALALARKQLGYDPQAGLIAVAHSATGFTTAGPRAAVKQLAAQATADPAVGAVQTAFGRERAPELISHDGRSTLVLIHFRSTDIDAAAGPIHRLRARLRAPGLTLSFTGYDLIFLDANRAARDDLVRAELIAFPLLALLMLLIFRGLVAALIPLLIGGASVAGTFACLSLLSGALNISIFALDLALLLGLGLAVDYGLFLVSRYREEASRAGHGREAIASMVRTAGRAVLFSGVALACASAALLLFPQEFIYSMGIAGVLVSLLSAAAALLLVPPMLLLAGDRVGTRAVPTEISWWQRWSRWIMRRPVDVALVSVLLLVAAAAPAIRLAPTFPDQSAVPKSFASRQAADAIDADFTPHLLYPADVVIDGGTRARIPSLLLASSLLRTSQVALATPEPSPPRAATLVQLILRHAPYSDQSQALITGIHRVPAPLEVGGNTAEFMDLKSSISGRLPLAIALVAATTLLALFLLTDSAVLALKALLFDALGLLAALGLLVLIFQHRILGLDSLVAYHGPSALDTTAVVVMIASTFGLTTDYSILLLSRIVEEHRAGVSDEDAVAAGIERSGPVITRSALLLVVALLALASSRVFLIKQLAVGQALGIVIDVSLVRLLLVPAMIRLLGRANWWTPRRLLGRSMTFW